MEAKEAAVNEAGIAIKCANLLRRSTTTQMVDLLLVRGRLVIKSIEISSQTWSGNGKGWRRP
jgi:hypothetical protein